MSNWAFLVLGFIWALLGLIRPHWALFGPNRIQLGLSGPYYALLSVTRVERDEYRLPKTYAVREKFSLVLICRDDTEKILFFLFESVI